MANHYLQTDLNDDRIKVLEGQVLDLTEMTDGDFLQYDESESALVGKSVSEMKTLLGLPVDKYIGYVTATGTTGDTTFTSFEHLDTKGITLAFAKDGSTAGIYNFTALSSLTLGKGHVFAQMNYSNNYSKNYSIELYSAGSLSLYQLRIYKDGTLSDLDNGDSIRFSIKMEDY